MLMRKGRKQLDPLRLVELSSNVDTEKKRGNLVQCKELPEGDGFFLVADNLFISNNYSLVVIVVI